LSGTEDPSRSGVVRVTLTRNGVVRDDLLAAEEPLAIKVNQRSIAVVLRTPTSLEDDLDLAVGFLVTEGVIDGPDDIAAVSHCSDPARPNRQNVVQINLHSGTAQSLERLDRAQRTQFVGSSCGICGKASMDRVFQSVTPFDQAQRLSVDLISELPRRLRAGQTLFESTGGLHGAGIFSAEGELRFLAEDIGRHNAVDKVIGRAFREGLCPLQGQILVVSSRAGFEIVQKALMAGISAVISVGAASSLADELARESRLALYSFVRDAQFNHHVD
jgi:FdhD protein